MKVSNDLTTFLFEFYNYARHVADEDTFGDKRREIAVLVQQINTRGFKTLFSSAAKGKKRSQPREGHDDTDGGAGHCSGKHARQTAMEDALRESGYEVQNENFDEFEPLVEVYSEISHLLRS